MASARGKPADADPADAPRRADAERSMSSSASPGDGDVGALTPARAPGTSADDMATRATTNEERARAGLESIRRADAAVEAARETARARAAERARARAEAERYAAAADALAAETRARVADDFAPLVGELSRARFFRDADGDPVAFSRIAGSADALPGDAGDALRPAVDEDAGARSVQRRGDDARARDKSARVVDRPVENVAENVPERGVATAAAATATTEIGEEDVPDPPPSRRRWSPARSSVDALRATGQDEAEEREGSEHLVSARRALSMPGRRGAEDRVRATSKTQKTPPRTPPRPARDGEKKPPVPRFGAELKPKCASKQTKTVTRRTETEAFRTKRSLAESRDPSRRPVAFVGATATGAAMCARLLDAGFPVVLAPPTIAGFKDDAEKRRAATLARHGATLARSPRHAAELAVFGTVEKDGKCAGFLPRAWAPGVRARDRRDAARRGQAPPQPTPVLILRPGAEEEDDEDDDEENEEDNEDPTTTRKRKKAETETFVARLRALDLSTRLALEDIFAPRSPRAATQNRVSFGGSLLVLNVNSATRKGALRNFHLLVTVIGVSFAQAATRGDPVDAEDGKMRVAIAAADVVAYEKRRDEKNARLGRPSVPSIKVTGSMCALKGAERVKCLSELDRVLQTFGERKDRLVVGQHPADAAVVGGGDPQTNYSYDDDEDDDDDDASRFDSLSYDRGDALSFADDASRASESVSEVSEAASEAADDDDRVTAPSASKRRSLFEKPEGSAKYISAAAARAWRLADARATARARERHAVATAPVLERLAFLERELERVSREKREVEASLTAFRTESDAERLTLRAALEREAETSRTNAASLAASERVNAELRDTLLSANADAAASRRDATTAAQRYEATERELGETLVLLEDERREKETMKADFLAASASAKAEAEAATNALLVERAELELTLKRRLEETEATARATAMRDEAEGKIKRAENVAAAAVASADAGARAAAEAVATLRAKLERAESERALARGNEARAIATLEAAEAECKATKKVLERVEKEASERVRRALASSQETRAEKEDAEARADAADALSASLEKSAEEARRGFVKARREFSAKERALVAERDAARAELAASKAAARRATREAEKLAAFVREVRENGGTLPANKSAWDDTKLTGSPWRPPSASPARATVSSAAKKVSLEGLVAQKGGLASPGLLSPERVPPPTSPAPASGRASLPSSPSSPSPGSHATPGTEKELQSSRGGGGSSRVINAARLEAAETRVARLESALKKADGEVAAARDAALEKLASVRDELARRTAERDGLFARHQAQTRLMESRAAERREAASLAETLALEKATLESRMNELFGLRHASDRVAERFAKDRAESSAAVASLRAEKDALAKELDETLARFAALGGAEATARAEREAAEEAAEHAKMEARRVAEEVDALKQKLDAATVERARAETELLGFKNGAFARAAEARVAEATRANDEKHEARAEMLRAEAALARAGAEAAATAARAELRDAAARERDAVAEAAAAAAEAAEIGRAVDAELERANCFLPETENRATPTRKKARVASSPSRLRSRKETLSPENQTQKNPTIFTPRAARLDAMRRARLELASVVPTRRALELALEQPDVLEALDALRFGNADPSPAAALACHLVRAVLDGDASFETSEKKETSESEDIAAAVLGDAFFTLDSKPETGNENAEKSFLGRSTSPASVRAALARCVAGDVGRNETENENETETETETDDAAYASAAAAAAEFSAAFDAIRPALGRTLPSRMRGARLDAANERGLRDATRAVRALMMGGGFGALVTNDERGERGDDDDDDDDVGSRFSRSNGFGPGSNDPLAEALFRWSACAVREWRLKRRAADAEKALARAEAEEEEDENGDANDHAASSGSPERVSFLSPAPAPRGKGKRHPLVVRAPASPIDARKIATHGAARALAKRERA